MLGQIRKHSYRQLAKRRFNRCVYEALQNINEFSKFIKGFDQLNKDTQLMSKALETAIKLIHDTKKGKIVNLSLYSPYIKEIKLILYPSTDNRQTNLF